MVLDAAVVDLREALLGGIGGTIVGEGDLATEPPMLKSFEEQDQCNVPSGTNSTYITYIQVSQG